MRRGTSVASIDLDKVLDKAWADKSLPEVLSAPVSALKGVSDRQGDLQLAYHELLFDADPAVHLPAAKAWSGWESRIITVLPDEEGYRKAVEDAQALSFAPSLHVRAFLLQREQGNLLGFLHRVPTLYTAEQVLSEVGEFAARGYPLDIIGLEPGWQSAAYPGTFVWDSTRFPDPSGFIAEMKQGGIFAPVSREGFGLGGEDEQTGGPSRLAVAVLDEDSARTGLAELSGRLGLSLEDLTVGQAARRQR